MKYLTARLKPLSINEAYKGKLTKTEALKQYERDLYYLLPNVKVAFPGPIKLKIEFGFSFAGADIDNPTKPVLDVLQRKYKFNDNRVYELRLVKVLVPKGQEYIRVRFKAGKIKRKRSKKS